MKNFQNKDLAGRIVAILSVVCLLHAAVAAQPADLVIKNAVIRTLDQEFTVADALAVRDGVFVFVGNSSDAAQMIGPSTQLIDAVGKTVVPGFNDSHVHLTNIGARLISPDLSRAANLTEVAEIVSRHARYLPNGQWIVGTIPPSIAAPDLQAGKGDAVDTPDFDRITPSNPILLYFGTSGRALVNGSALEIARIRTNRYIVEGAELDRVKRSVPDAPDRRRVLEAALRYAAAFGVTSLQDVSSDDLSDDLRELGRSGSLSARVYDCVGIDKPLPKIDRDPRKMIRTGCVKHYSDGDPSEIPGLVKRLAEADRGGAQIMLHAIGPKANAVVLTVFERIKLINGKRDRRLRVEHAQGFRPKDLNRFAAIPAIVSMQPALFENGKANYARVFRKISDAGIRMAFGSDSAMIPIDPLDGVMSAAGKLPGLFLTEDEALRAYTFGSAYAEFQDEFKGTIEVGKFADFVILNSSVARGAEVNSTFVGGRLVFEATNEESPFPNNLFWR